MIWSFDAITSRDPSDEVIESITEKAREVEGLNHNVFEIRIVNKAYQVLLVQAACLVCLAHGSNDVANSITPLLVELRVTNH